MLEVTKSHRASASRQQAYGEGINMLLSKAASKRHAMVLGAEKKQDVVCMAWKMSCMCLAVQIVIQQNTHLVPSVG